jgi:hypothetical protein
MVQGWRKKEPAEQERIRKEAAAFIAAHVPAAVVAPVPTED